MSLEGDSDNVSQTQRELALQKSTGLIVVGMHRSGTSALTGALQAIGAYAGGGDDLTGANAENPKGFFERRDLRNICDALLHAAEADWWKVSEFEPGDVDPVTLEKQREKFVAVTQALSKHQVWVIKEPRLCLLLPLLADLVSNPVCLLIYRNPIEVAKSLRTRNRISLQQGIALWERYTLSAINATNHMPRIMVSYEDLITKPTEALDQIIRQLTDLGVGPFNEISASAGFIDKALHRSMQEPGELEMLTQPQQYLWRQLSEKRVLDSEEKIASSPGLVHVLRDLEHQFIRNENAHPLIFDNTLGSQSGDHSSNRKIAGYAGIRSAKVLRFSLFLDRLIHKLRSALSR